MTRGRRALLAIGSGAAIACVVQGCSSDDPIATAPDASTSADASTDDRTARRTFSTTAGACGATKSSSARLREPERLAHRAYDHLAAVAVFGTGLLFAGSRSEAGEGGQEPRLHVGRVDGARAPIWTRTFGESAQARAMAMTPNEGMIVVGSFTKSLNVGGATLAADSLWGDAFVAGFGASDGVHRFSVQIGGERNDSATAVAVDASGHVWVAGSYNGPITVGATELGGNSALQAFVAHLDADGNVLGAFQRPGRVSAIAIDPSSGDLVLGGGASDGFVARVSTSGEERWTKTLGATREGEVTALALDAAGDIYATGFVQDVATDDAVVMRLDGAGNEKWRKRWDGDEGVVALSVALGPDGAVLVGGATSSVRPVDFGGGPISGGIDGGAFVVELGPDGVHRCSRLWTTYRVAPPDGGFVASVAAVAFTGNTSFIAAGVFSGVLDVGKGPMTSAGGTDVWVGDFNR